MLFAPGVKELAAQFPGLSEPIIKARLRDRCECVPSKVTRFGPEPNAFPGDSAHHDQGISARPSMCSWEYS